MKIKWTKTKGGDMTGKFEQYQINIFKMPHGGWCYQLFFRKKDLELFLSSDGYHGRCIETLHAAKYKSLKKLNFFYAQQHNQTEKM